ncbi:MAG: NHL repeat-containing protein [Sedimentisphaerales bacterium]
MEKVKVMSMRLECVLLAIAFLLLPLALCIASEAELVSSLSATHKEVKSIGLTPETRFENLTTFCMTQNGNLLACDAEAREIKVINPMGRLLTKWKLKFAPYSIDARPDGSVYVAGQGVVAKLDKAGKVLKTVEADGANLPKAKPSGITATEKELFVAFGSGWSLRSRSSIVRFDRDLGQATVIAEDLRGCCQRLDMVARDGVLYVAENARHRVVKYDRNGKVLAKWGKRDRKNVEGFGSCCNPMNLCFSPKGELYTAEAGLGRIKRYSADGKFLALVGYVGVERFSRAGRLAAACSNIALAMSKDESRIYVLDFKNNIIRVMEKIDTKS